MNLSRLNKLAWSRANILLKNLFPEYKYIKVTRNGIVKYKSKWYHLWHKDNIYRMLHTDIPLRLFQNVRDYDPSKSVKQSHRIYDSADIIAQLYDEYLNSKHITRTMPKTYSRKISNRNVRYLYKSPTKALMTPNNKVSLIPAILVAKSIQRILK